MTCVFYESQKKPYWSKSMVDQQESTRSTSPALEQGVTGIHPPTQTESDKHDAGGGRLFISILCARSSSLQDEGDLTLAALKLQLLFTSSPSILSSSLFSYFQLSRLSSFLPLSFASP